MPAPDPSRPEGADTALRRALHDVLRGDQTALDTLLALCWESVVNYAASITGGFDSAEDIAQETFVRLWTSREIWHLRGGASIGLIFRIARNLALNHVRAGRRRERHLSIYSDERALPDSEPAWAENAQLRTSIDAALAALPPRRREIFTLARFHGLTYAEIAETMGISKQTVANQMSAALDALRQALQPFVSETEGDGEQDAG